MSKPLTTLDAASLWAIALIWGVNNVATMAALSHFPPLLMAGLRFLTTAIALAPFLRFPRERPWVLLGVAALSGPVHFGLVYAGFAAADAVTPVVVAAQLWVPFSVLLAAVMLGERVGLARGAGVGVAFLGVAAMGFDPKVFSQGLALSLIAAGAFVWALVSVLIRRFGALRPLELQAWTAVVALAPLALASAGLERDQALTLATAPIWAWGAVLFAGLVSSVGANALLFRLVQRYEVARTTPVLLATPLISAALGVVFLGDRLSPQVMAGAALTMAGVGVCALADRRSV